MSLDPTPSPEQLRRIAEERLARRQAPAARPAWLIHGEARGSPLGAAAPSGALAALGLTVVEIGDPVIARRDGDQLWLAIPHPPRTKKNGTTNGQPRAAVKRFAWQVRQHLAQHLSALGLPLPDRWYNLQAHFFTDNDRCDTIGLVQGLADALEAAPTHDFAGVVTNDRWFRRFEGTDWWHDPIRPRVEVTITPLTAGGHDAPLTRAR